MTSCDTLSPEKFVKQIVYQIWLGFSCAIRGFILSWNNTYVWQTQKRSLLSLLVCTIIIYTTLVIAFLPFRLIVWLISFAYKFAPSVIEWLEHVSSARTLLFKLLSFIPLLAVFIMNNLLGYDKLFFSVLASVNPSLAKRLNSRARQSFTSSLYFFARRTLLIFATVTCVHFLRSIPYLGQLIPALWVLKYARYTITNTKHVYLRTIFFILLFLLTIFKSLQSYTISLLYLQMASTALARELFDTYLSRIHTHTLKNHQPITINTHPPPSTYQFLGFLVPRLFHPLLNWRINSNIDTSSSELALPHRKITHFLRENYFLLLAFAFPYIFLFSIPLLGFFCVGFAHGAAAYTLAIITK
ncbi:unnamed protein product [Rotaria sordida]|uniref:Uncharacterized protein n=1 Tax=Rotaria sordida TaxID=392033 RepID=A0A818LTN9_9BILA|nr:unnamed protein product [Rotaria sordida]CAF1054834.1 unnamed protein product [Rotaria sordida]CAF1167954.1 unnamed protein product [Rotaria sordida]CAF3577565.1 unnamed protein product [Rotaria sordida]CAF3775850.1 unnamed protein product [Rotaria sordida]